MGEFQEKHNVQIAMFSTGATAEIVSPYYSMRDYRRADFYVSGLVNITGAGEIGGTHVQTFFCRVLEASNSTGGGASGLSSATALIGKDSASGISTSVKMREGVIIFGTLDKATDLTLTVGTAGYQTSSAATTANRFVVKGSSAAATVAAEAFVAMFNNSSQNTSTAITANWKAATVAGCAAVRILPKDPDSSYLLNLGNTNSSMIGLGGVFQAHLGIDRQFMSDGKTHLAIGVYSTADENVFSVSVIREADFAPVKPVTLSKSINRSTSK